MLTVEYLPRYTPSHNPSRTFPPYVVFPPYVAAKEDTVISTGSVLRIVRQFQGIVRRKWPEGEMFRFILSTLHRLCTVADLLSAVECWANETRQKVKQQKHTPLRVERTAEVDVVLQKAIGCPDRRPEHKHRLRRTDVDGESYWSDRRTFLCARQHTGTGRAADNSTRLEAELVRTPSLQSRYVHAACRRWVVDENSVMVQTIQHDHACISHARITTQPFNCNSATTHADTSAPKPTILRTFSSFTLVSHWSPKISTETPVHCWGYFSRQDTLTLPYLILPYTNNNNNHDDIYSAVIYGASHMREFTVVDTHLPSIGG